MAILKHIASKSSNYGAALEYLIFKHDELRKTPILDQNGNRIMRDEFYLDGLNCEPYSFDAACQQLNREYQKNKNKDEIKSHHYIISFDPRDSTENCLTGKRAQELGLEYAKANFPGHQALVCTHMDGHNGSGNIHVHEILTREDFLNYNELYSKRIEEYDRKIEELEAERQNLQTAPNAYPFLDVYRKYRKLEEITRPMVVELIEKIEVYEGNRVEITFRFHDEIADLLEELHQKQMGQREVSA